MSTEIITYNEVYPPEIAAWTDAEKIGQNQAGKDIIGQIKKEYEEGSKYFRIPPGNYRFSGKSGIELENMHDFKIDATGVTFWFTREVRFGIRFKNCSRVEFSGLTVDKDGMPFFQGTIEQLDHVRNIITVELDENYIEYYRSRPKLKRFRVMFLDAEGLFETDNIDFRPRYEDIRDDGGNRIYITMTDSLTEHWKYQLRPPRLGDRIVIGMRQEGGTLLVSGCGNMRFEDISIYASQGFAFFEEGHGDGGNYYRNCRLIRRPDTGRLLAGAADCFHSLNQKHGPVIENCEFSWAMDDLTNIHGFFQVILKKISDNEIIVAAPHGTRYEIGSELRFYTPKFGQECGRARVTAFEDLSKSDVDLGIWAHDCFRKKHNLEIRELYEGYPCRVKLDRQVLAEAFDLASSNDYCCAGSVVRNSYLHDGHVRGILIKSPGSSIINNRIERTALNAVAVKPERYWLEGPMPYDIEISDNRISNCAFDFRGLGAILIQSGFCTSPEDRLTGEANMVNITIKNNRINYCNSGMGIFVANCIEPHIFNNEISHPFSNSNAIKKISIYNIFDLSYGVELKNSCHYENISCAIFFTGCKDIECRNNRVNDPSNMCFCIEYMGPWCEEKRNLYNE